MYDAKNQGSSLLFKAYSMLFKVGSSVHKEGELKQTPPSTQLKDNAPKSQDVHHS